MKWISKKFTFVVIPDANQSVQHYRVSGLILFLVPTVVAILVICALVFFSLFSRHSVVVDELQARLSLSEAEYEQQLSEKDMNISAMQTDLAYLSEQAKTMENKMAEINELESQLKQIVGIDTESSKASSKLVTEEGGQGGEELPLSEGSADSLAAETKKYYSYIGLQIQELKPSLEETKKAVLKYQQILNVTPTIWPTDSRKVTSLFGIRSDPFTGRATYHAGLDIGGATGDPVYAAADGVVTLSGIDKIYGNNITIHHGRGILTRYFHLSKRIADVGEKVKKGQLIGDLGSTGRSTGPHLHYEVSVNGNDVNPLPYLKADRKEP